MIQYISTDHAWLPGVVPRMLAARSGSGGFVDEDATWLDVVPIDRPIATAIATATSTRGM